MEQSAVRALRAELCECRQDNERLLQSLGSVQREVLQLRYGTPSAGGRGAHAGCLVFGWCWHVLRR